MQSINKNIDLSFYLTFVFLTTTATITFIEAMRTKDETIRHILNLETVISVIAAFFYNVFITEIKETRENNKEIDWEEFRNCILTTSNTGYKKIATKVFKSFLLSLKNFCIAVRTSTTLSVN